MNPLHDPYLLTLTCICLSLIALTLFINRRNGRLKRELADQETAADERSKYLSAQLRKAYEEIDGLRSDAINLSWTAGAQGDEIETLRSALMREAPRTRTFLNDPTKYKVYLNKIANLKKKGPNKEKAKTIFQADPAGVDQALASIRAANGGGKGVRALLGEEVDRTYITSDILKINKTKQI
jgi:hypothetical protein